ncbi:ABC transporter permease, partial [Bacillus vallismortis]|nr:ABC transporter permease [Bacillus vallismortis]
MFETYFPNVYLTELWNATNETLYMTLISLLFDYVIGVILCLLL